MYSIVTKRITSICYGKNTEAHPLLAKYFNLQLLKHMKLFALLTAIIVFLNACNQSMQPKNDIDKEPEAFEDKKLSLEIVSKSRGEDILDKLYAELVEKMLSCRNWKVKLMLFIKAKEIQQRQLIFLIPGISNIMPMPDKA